MDLHSLVVVCRRASIKSPRTPSCGTAWWGLSCAIIALMMGGCGVVPQEPPPGKVGISDLRSRAVSIATLASDSTCPSSSPVNLEYLGSIVPAPAGSSPRPKLAAYGYGSGPVYLSGQMVGAMVGAGVKKVGWSDGDVAMIMVDAAYSGPVLIRGHQANGPGQFPLSSHLGEIALSDGKSAMWRTWYGQIDGPPGCYAVQVDTIHSTDYIWFLIVPGP